MDFIAVKGRRENSSHLPPVLIIPALSIGNAGQLAADLLISTCACTKAGYLDDPYILPCIGNDPFGPAADGTLAVSAEVFEDGQNDLAIVQQRSPVVKGKMVEYSRHIAKFAESAGVKEVIILSGLDSGKRKRRELGGSPEILYVSSAEADGSDEDCEKLGWKRLEQAGEVLQYEEAHSEGLSLAGVALTDDNYYAGLPFALLFSSCKALGLKVVCVLSFCSEGDNTPDAFFIAESLHHLVQQKQGKEIGSLEWKIPLSWTTVYGPPPDDTIF